MHDDCIAGVTFEENASRNALIVNEEYAWVGNPFSAQREKGEPKRFSLFSLKCAKRTGPRPLRPQCAPSRGRGCQQLFAGKYSRAARVQVPFSAPKQQGEPQRFSLLLCVLRGGPVPCDLNAPLPGAGGVNSCSRENTRAQRECESRFPLQSNRENQNGAPFLVEMCEENGPSSPGDLNAPLPGAGGVNNRSREHTRAQRECKSRFPLQNNRERHPGAPRCFLLYVG